MKRRLLLAVLVLSVGAFIWALARSLPPVAITARFIARTNYPNGWIGCLIAVTNVTTNNLVMLVPMDTSMARGFRTPVLPTNVFFCPVQVPVGGGKVAPLLQTEAHPQKVRIHFGQPRDHSGIVYRLRRWLHLPRGQPRDFLSNPQTLDLDLPPE
jgi:hypothetical protein